MAIDFSDLGGKPIDSKPIDFSDLGGKRVDDNSGPNPYVKAASDYLMHPLIEGGAMTLGGAAGGTVGSIAGPVAGAAGGIAGAASMYGPAHHFANAIDENYLGIPRNEGGGTIPQQVGQSFNDFGTGLANEAGGAVLGAAGRGVVKGVSKGAKAAMSTALGPSGEAISARLANPDAIRNAPSYADQAYQLPETLENLKGQITQLHGKAKSLLRTSSVPEDGAIPKSSIQSLLDDLRSKLDIHGSVVGQADKSASSQLQALNADIENIMKPKAPAVNLLDASGKPIVYAAPDVHLPESSVKQILDSARNNINFEDKGATVTNGALTDFSGKLDAMLKQNNPDYAEAMKPVAERMGVLDKIKKAFSLKQRTGEGITPTDATIGKIQNLPKEKKEISQELMNQLKGYTGVDYNQRAQNYGYNRQFQGGQTNGSRHVNLAMGLGGAIGSGIGWATGQPGLGATIGAGSGAALGGAVDKYGGTIAGSLIDKYAAARPALQKVMDLFPGKTGARAIAALVNHIYSEQPTSGQ